MNNAHLASPCANKSELCLDSECPHAIKQNPGTKRWYITMGHAGFNLPANNRDGYATAKNAKAAMQRLTARAYVAARQGNCD